MDFIVDNAILLVLNFLSLTIILYYAYAGLMFSSEATCTYE